MQGAQRCAEVVKLVDTLGLGPSGGNPVEVRVLSSAFVQKEDVVTPLVRLF